MKNNFRIGICQMNVIDNKNANLDSARSIIRRAVEGGAEIVVLPEMFNCPYDTSKFPEYAEDLNNSKSLKAVSSLAQELGIHLIAGSIPEIYNEKLYNSSFIYNNEGKLLDVHRKMHLFDVDIADGISFKESETITAGNSVTVVDTPLCKIGVAICYDVRFPELFRLMTLKGAELMILPGAFNMTTGPAHWETTLRGRAIDNQVYMVAASPARNENLSYVAYGNSMVVDPWGNVIARAGAYEEIIYADLDLSRVNDVREQLPLIKNRRTDIYNLIEMDIKKG